MITNTNVRFFTYCLNEDEDADICEITESQFMTLAVDETRYEMHRPIQYERHTVRENGCNQVCLTVEPRDYPLISDLESWR